ncbi:MAG TPA: hypothetical protein ENJ84_06755 [Gammaproteobacteria bacterium]|nr:hypothetical protein [Gammaproteobacteria bacterium]
MSDTAFDKMKTELVRTFCYTVQKQDYANVFASKLWNADQWQSFKDPVGEFISETEGLFSLTEKNYWALFPFMLEFYFQHQSDERFGDIIDCILFQIQSGSARYDFVNTLTETQKELVAEVLKDIFVQYPDCSEAGAQSKARKILMMT